MKRSRFLSHVFIALAILLSDVMCATVAYTYCDMWWGARYAAYSAPARVAFLLIIPYGMGILICAILAWFFSKREEKP